MILILPATLLILIGGVFLLATRIANWRTVVAIDSTTAVGTQARTNADLLEDVLQSTVYKKGKRSRILDMSGEDVKSGTGRRGTAPEESEEKK